jgi:hypothetical protein
MPRDTVVDAAPGSRVAERARADGTGLVPKESVIETLCGLAQELAVGGFRVFSIIPKMRLRRGRPLDPRLRRRWAFFSRHPFRLCICHWLSPELLVLVRQLRGSHLSPCQ